MTESGRHMPRHRRGKNRTIRTMSLKVMEFHIVSVVLGMNVLGSGCLGEYK
jgi:hypothetical protein